jgi:hypothetical protein
MEPRSSSKGCASKRFSPWGVRRGRRVHGQSPTDHRSDSPPRESARLEAERHGLVDRAALAFGVSTCSHTRLTNRVDAPGHGILTCAYASEVDQLDPTRRDLQPVPCGTAAHSLAPWTTHQDPDQVRTNSASHQTFPPFVAGQKRGQTCTTSRRRICWDERAPRPGTAPCPRPRRLSDKDGLGLSRNDSEPINPRCPSSTERSQHQVSTGGVRTGDDVGF